MPNQAKVHQEKESHLSIVGILNRDTVMDCWPEQTSFLDKVSQQESKDLTVDLAKVENADTAGLAWLIHLIKACKANRINLNLTNIPDSLANLARLSNIEDLLPSLPSSN